MENRLSPADMDDAENTLLQLEEDRSALARTTSPPLWFTVATSVLATSFILAFALSAEWFVVGVTAVAVISVALGLFRQRIVGGEADAWGDRSARRAGLVILAIVVIVAVLTVLVYSTQSWVWVLVVGALLVGGLTFTAATVVTRRAGRGSVAQGSVAR